MIFYPSFLKRGITLTPWLILIPRWAKGNPDYLAHERTHAKQQRRVGTLTFWWRYLTDPAYRLTAEIEAYRAQIAAGGDVDYCATQLAYGYSLTLTPAKAYALLQD